MDSLGTTSAKWNPLTGRWEIFCTTLGMQLNSSFSLVLAVLLTGSWPVVLCLTFWSCGSLFLFQVPCCMLPLEIKFSLVFKAKKKSR